MTRRAEYGSGTVARPDEKMGGMRGHPTYGEKGIESLHTAVRKVLKQNAARKRRQRDRAVTR